MTQQANSEQSDANRHTRGRGPAKPYPMMKFEDALLLPKSVEQYSLGGEIQRLTLFGKLNRAPDSGPGLALVRNSRKYGLIARGQSSDSLSLTDDGRVALDADGASREALEVRFRLAIGQFTPFSTIYDKLKGRAFQEGPVLKDELVKAGVAENDRDKAAEVFSANLRFLGLVKDIGGRDYVESLEEILGSILKSAEDSTLEPPSLESPVETVSTVTGNGKATAETKRPALHVDIQVHIDPTSSAEQIDQIFASMARHFYGNES